MKRLIFSTLLCIAFIKFSTAQISLLVEGGANYGQAKFSKNALISNENILGYYISGIPKYKLNERLAIQSEFQYSVEGYGFDGFFGYEKNRFHYMRIIPGLEVKMLGPLSLIVGINYGYLALIQTQIEGEPTHNRTNFFNKNDVGILTGINISLAQINFTVKYNYGLVSIADLRMTDIQGNDLGQTKIKNRFLQVGVGYRIDFKI